jgi:hypothetical protein
MTQVEAPLTGTKPALILDLDGVVVLEADKISDGYEALPSFPWQAYNPSHADWLRDILSMADIYYISDWRQQSHTYFGKSAGLPELDWIDSYKHSVLETSNAEKRARAISALFGRRPLVWLDDLDNKETSSEYSWAAKRSAQVAPTLFVSPDTARGLEPQHMELVTAWLQAVNALKKEAA